MQQAGNIRRNTLLQEQEIFNPETVPLRLQLESAKYCSKTVFTLLE